MGDAETGGRREGRRGEVDNCQLLIANLRPLTLPLAPFTLRHDPQPLPLPSLSSNFEMMQNLDVIRLWAVARKNL